MTDRPTREQVAAEPAGRRLDAWVHEIVFGRVTRPVRVCGSTETVEVYDDKPHYTDGWYDRGDLARAGTPPAYSTDPGAAWAVVEHLRAAGWFVKIYDPMELDEWGICLLCPGRPEVSAMDAKMPVAVCRAAVLAVLEG